MRGLVSVDTGNVDDDRRAKTLIAILLAILPVALVNAAYVWPETNGPESAVVILLACLVFVGVIVLARTGHLQVAVAAFAAMMWLVVVAQPVFTGDMSTNLLVVPLGAVILVYVVGRRQLLWVSLWSVSALVVLYVGTTDAETVVLSRSLWLGNAALVTVITVAVAVFGARQLRTAVRQQAELADQLSARERIVARLEELALTDPLTGFRNRRSLEETFARLPQRSALALLDLDNFKRINDHHSHATGDELLVRFSELVAQLSMPDDHLYRIGGDEFLVLREDSSAPALGAWLHEVRDLMARQSWPRAVDGGRVSFSAGVVDVAGRVLEQVLRGADGALYAAKESGRDAIVVVDF